MTAFSIFVIVMYRRHGETCLRYAGNKPVCLRNRRKARRQRGSGVGVGFGLGGLESRQRGTEQLVVKRGGCGETILLYYKCE